MKPHTNRRARVMPGPSAKAQRAASRLKLDLRPTLAAARAGLAHDGKVTFGQFEILRQAGDLPARAN
jgi:hypothetical protein